MKKFKPVVEATPETPVEELSENQKRKIEQQKKKVEDEERQRIENERLAKQRAID